MIWWTTVLYQLIPLNLENWRFGELQRPPNLRLQSTVLYPPWKPAEYFFFVNPNHSQVFRKCFLVVLGCLCSCLYLWPNGLRSWVPIILGLRKYFAQINLFMFIFLFSLVCYKMFWNPANFTLGTAFTYQCVLTRKPKLGRLLTGIRTAQCLRALETFSCFPKNIEPGLWIHTCIKTFFLKLQYSYI